MEESRVLLVNGSPKGARSDTLKLACAFLEGMGERGAEIEASALDIAPCRGCFSCWRDEGRCVQPDDMARILERVVAAELIVWSTPLYCYGVPSACKAILDRLLPLSSPAMRLDERGRTHHRARDGRAARTRHVLVAGCGFPERAGNFDSLEFQFRRMFGDDTALVLCTEAPLLSEPEAEPATLPYLAAVRAAGAEYRETGRISETVQRVLDAPMLDPNVYRALASS